MIARSLILDILGLFSKPAPYVQILNGHMVSRFHDNIEDGKIFEKQLEDLHKYCDFVNFETAVELIKKGIKVKKSTVAFSFDDGWRDCYTQIAPQLDKYGVNAAFFINPNFIDAGERSDKEYLRNFTLNVTNSPGKSPLSWEQIGDLSRRGYIIGAHTLDHFCINDDNTTELEHQICDCKDVIEKQTGKSCDYFAFPYGKLSHANQNSIDIACRTYSYVFSQSDHKHYFSYDGRVINRRHFEPFWPVKHVFYFLRCKRV